MKKIDNRDQININKTQDLMRRYDFSILDRLGAIKGNDNAIGIGMDPTVEAGVQSKDGFYDENGDNILNQTILQPILLPDGTNLNNVTDPGLYYSESSTSTATMSNSPSNLSFSLLVEKHYGTTQTLTNYSTTLPIRWIRNEHGDGWGDWEQVVTENSIDDILRDLNLRNRRYESVGDLGYSAGVSLATFCSAMAIQSEFLGQQGDFESSDKPTDTFYTIHILKHSDHRCSITARMAQTTAYPHMYHANWRADTGFNGWYDLT